MYVRAEINKIKEQLDSPFRTPDFLDKSYYPSLNGWRAIAVIFVIGEHLKGNIGYNSTYTKITNSIFFGRLGVDIFFVLSGFLITSILIKEKIKTGEVNIPKFFLRRVLRIFPVLYLFLACCAILNYPFQLNILFISFISPALYISNIIYSNPILAHTWSLSVEEQYYLIWPMVLKMLKFPILLYMVLIVLMPLVNVLTYLYPSGIDLYIHHIYIPATTLLTGAIMAILSFKNIIHKRFLKSTIFTLSMLTTVLIFYLKHNGLLGIIILPFGSLITNILIVYCIVYSLNFKNHPFVKFLNHQMINKIGLMSYSIYIWQQLLLQPKDSYLYWQKFTFFPLNLVFIGLVSYISYQYFELYFLKLKAKYVK